MSAQPNRSPNAARGILKAHAYQVLTSLQDHPPEQPVGVHVALGPLELRMVCQPRGEAGSAAMGRQPGDFFSPLESAIWLALADGQPRIGKRIAAEVRQKLTGTFKVLLRNLCDRHVLIRDGAGYRRAR